MPPPPIGSAGPLAKRPALRVSPFARIRRQIGAWITDAEYRLRISRPFAHGRGATRVFFPGCSLPAADPDLVMRAYEWLRERDPTIQLWSDCCGQPLEKFSTRESAERGRERTRRMLEDSGTKEIVTACGNCTVQFDSLKVPGLRLTSLYGLLAEEDWGPRPTSAPTVVLHPCSARIDKDQQVHFRRLADRLHLQVVNADDPKHPLACCLVTSPTAMARRKALADSKMVTYCAHCTMAFQQDVPTRHVLQEVFGSAEERWHPRGKIERFLQYKRFAQMAAARDPASTNAHSPDAVKQGARSPLSWVAKVTVAVFAAIAMTWFARHGDLSRRALQLVSWSRDAGASGVLAYGAAYVLATVLALPGAVLTLGAGFAWGPVAGVAIVSPVSVLAATAAFVLGRTLLRKRVERWVGANPRIAAADRAIGDHGLKIVMLLRLSPILPFNALNYALALTRVRLRDYVIGSALGMLPGTVLYVYLGSLVTNGTQLLSGQRPNMGFAASAVYWIGLAATLLVVVQATRLARAELKKVLVVQKS